jgi:serine/threonine protein kinase
MESALTRTSFREQPFCNTTVGNYLLFRQLGSGSFAQVYLAKHLYLQNLTALKLFTLPSVNQDEWQQFQFEARILARLRHPHIVRALDFGWEKGMPYLVMEYAPGGSLQQVFPLGKALHISFILPTVLQIASALQFIHNHGVIHCDVKPANVLRGPDDVVWLSDFGIATTLTSASAVLYGRESVPGTPSYIAPERMYGYALPASDQYALAVMVYQWLCGVCPFEGSVHEVCFQQVSTPPPPLRDHVPSISPAVERVVLKALAKEPQKRFAHVQEFAFALKQASW